MTNQNVVVSDVKGLGIAVATVPNNQSLFSSVVPKLLSTPAGGCITISRNKLQRLETGGGTGTGARISSWVDSMRASSPPRVVKSITTTTTTTTTNASLSETEEYKSAWTLRHPSALSMFEQITNASKGKQIVMFLDYDVYSFVKLAELYYAGSHGMDIKGPSKCTKYKNAKEAVLFQPATEFLPMVDEVYKILFEKTKSIPGARVEHNRFCLSVHFRCVDEKSWDALAEQVKFVLNEYPKLRLTQGRKVLEIRPTIKWDKGKALEFLLESLGYANSNDVLPVYIGDDRTDEDAFKVLHDRGQGFGILVSKVPKETIASYSLQEPSEVKDFLRQLVKWKRLTMRTEG
ncbi:Trehalose-phosphatase [Parasponia andersonii]|uniref:Trehalose 6-phosphate phosphatase n=1 Tax=Parasponia andersonii TaxID=3476 RepID=A0A2P5CKN1_PARAD|nr:Trehalose-phosphatase [Parasponia andersonii]